MSRLHITHYYHNGVRKVCTVMHIKRSTLVIDSDLLLDMSLYRLQMVLSIGCIVAYSLFAIIVTVQAFRMHELTSALYCLLFAFIMVCMAVRAIALATQHRRCS